MLHYTRSRFRLSSVVAAAGLVAAATALAANSAEAPFLAETQAAMDKMMAGMDITPSGDADRDFAATMIPHHQGAIDMAQVELRHGKNEQLRRADPGESLVHDETHRHEFEHIEQDSSGILTGQTNIAARR